MAIARRTRDFDHQRALRNLEGTDDALKQLKHAEKILQNADTADAGVLGRLRDSLTESDRKLMDHQQQATSTRAKVLMTRGKAHSKLGDYDAATRDFEAAEGIISGDESISGTKDGKRTRGMLKFYKAVNHVGKARHLQASSGGDQQVHEEFLRAEANLAEIAEPDEGGTKPAAKYALDGKLTRMALDSLMKVRMELAGTASDEETRGAFIHSARETGESAAKSKTGWFGIGGRKARNETNLELGMTAYRNGDLGEANEAFNGLDLRATSGGLSEDERRGFLDAVADSALATRGGDALERGRSFDRAEEALRLKGDNYIQILDRAFEVDDEDMPHLERLNALAALDDGRHKDAADLFQACRNMESQAMQADESFVGFYSPEKRSGMLGAEAKTRMVVAGESDSLNEKIKELDMAKECYRQSDPQVVDDRNSGYAEANKQLFEGLRNRSSQKLESDPQGAYSDILAAAECAKEIGLSSEESSKFNLVLAGTANNVSGDEKFEVMEKALDGVSQQYLTEVEGKMFHRLKGEAHLGKGRFGEAAKSFEKVSGAEGVASHFSRFIENNLDAIDDNNARAECFGILGSSYLKTGDFDQALQVLDKAVDYGDNADGFSLSRLNNLKFQRASAYLGDAVKLTNSAVIRNSDGTIKVEEVDEEKCNLAIERARKVVREHLVDMEGVGKGKKKRLLDGSHAVNFDACDALASHKLARNPQDKQAALQIMNSARESALQLGLKGPEVDSLNRRTGNIAFELGAYELAADCLYDLNPKSMSKKELEKLGVSALKDGDYDTAVSTFKYVDRNHKTLGLDDASRVAVWDRLGDAYREKYLEVGDQASFKKAMDFYTRVQTEVEKPGREHDFFGGDVQEAGKFKRRTAHRIGWLAMKHEGKAKPGSRQQERLLDTAEEQLLYAAGMDREFFGRVLQAHRGGEGEQVLGEFRDRLAQGANLEAVTCLGAVAYRRARALRDSDGEATADLARGAMTVFTACDEKMTADSGGDLSNLSRGRRHTANTIKNNMWVVSSFIGGQEAGQALSHMQDAYQGDLANERDLNEGNRVIRNNMRVALIRNGRANEARDVQNLGEGVRDVSRSHEAETLRTQASLEEIQRRAEVMAEGALRAVEKAVKAGEKRLGVEFKPGRAPITVGRAQGEAISQEDANVRKIALEGLRDGIRERSAAGNVDGQTREAWKAMVGSVARKTGLEDQSQWDLLGQAYSRIPGADQADITRVRQSRQTAVDERQRRAQEEASEKDLSRQGIDLAKNLVAGVGGQGLEAPEGFRNPGEAADLFLQQDTEVQRRSLRILNRLLTQEGLSEDIEVQGNRFNRFTVDGDAEKAVMNEFLARIHGGLDGDPQAQQLTVQAVMKVNDVNQDDANARIADVKASLSAPASEQADSAAVDQAATESAEASAPAPVFVPAREGVKYKTPLSSEKFLHEGKEIGRLAELADMLEGEGGQEFLESKRGDLATWMQDQWGGNVVEAVNGPQEADNPPNAQQAAFSIRRTLFQESFSEGAEATGDTRNALWGEASRQIAHYLGQPGEEEFRMSMAERANGLVASIPAGDEKSEFMEFISEHNREISRRLGSEADVGGDTLF